jgi:3-hydroxyisobutyrate dehydrogenase
MTKVAFFGLGNMGYPMAGHLSKGGHQVTVIDPVEGRPEKWIAEFDGKTADTPREAVQGAEMVFACVGTDNDLRGLALGGDGAFGGMKSGSIFIDHTTATADIEHELAAVGRDRGIQYIDAPVSGGQAGAEKGALTVMCGGEQEAFDRALPVIDCFAVAVTLIGPVGSGQLTKMVSQIAHVIAMQGAAEAMNFGSRAGLDMDRVLAAISKGAAQSWCLDNRSATMLEGKYDFGFAAELMQKDLRICLAEAGNLDARLPVVALINQFYTQVIARGDRRWDTSSLMHLLAND